MPALNLTIKDRIAILEFDRPDSKVNVLDTETMRELASVIERLKNLSNSKSIRALIITSRKEGIFIAGADIKEIDSITSSEEAKEKSEKGKEILNNLANLGLVTAAVINGACLGGGFELTLACKYRVAGTSERVKIGLPEVNLGIMPGFGGTQRLPRLIGPARALNMILSAQIISAREALRYGVVDRLFPDRVLTDNAFEFVNNILDGKIEPGRRKKRLPERFLEDTPVGRQILFSQAKKNVLKKTKGFYPAPLKALDIIRRTYGRDIKRGSLLESIAFGELAATDVSKNLIKIFFLSEEFKKLSWVSSEIKPGPVNKCGVLGAGVMGGGIAQLIAFRNIPVRLKDISYDALKKALKTASALFEYAVKNKKLKKHEADYKLGLISPTTAYKGFENMDLVVEAVVEDLKIKQNVFRELSKVVPAKAILASNTSSLPIIKMAEAMDLPERLVGLHFFNPVHRMPLIEIIRSKKTGDEAVAGAIAFARGLGKVVIVVRDVPGFLINRILLPYLNEAGFLIAQDGVPIELIDEASRDFGMPIGPVELIDEIGIDVGYKVASILEESYGRRMEVSPLLGKVKEAGMLGKKTGLGFYIHRGKKKIPNPKIYALTGRPKNVGIPKHTLQKRLFYVMINEAARCLEEGVADRPETVDIGMIMGTGFPPFRAGLLRYADSVGPENIVKDLKDFENQKNHERFRPCGYIAKLAADKKGFYG